MAKNIPIIASFQNLVANLKLENRENSFRLVKTIISFYFYISYLFLKAVKKLRIIE